MSPRGQYEPRIDGAETISGGTPGTYRNPIGAKDLDVVLVCQWKHLLVVGKVLWSLVTSLLQKVPEME